MTTPPHDRLANTPLHVEGVKVRSIARRLLEDRRLTLDFIDREIAESHPKLKTHIRRDQLTWGLGITLMFGALIALTTFMGGPTGSSAAGLRLDQALSVAPIFSLIGLVGIIISHVIWFQRGKGRARWDTGMVAVATASAALTAFILHTNSGSMGPGFMGPGFIGTALTAVVGLISLSWRLFGAAKFTDVELKGARIRELIEQLPHMEQAELAAQRSLILQLLLDARALSEPVHHAAQASRWGTLAAVDRGLR